MAFPAPPFYRALKRKPKTRAQMSPPASGRTPVNAGVAPLTITNGTGTRVLDKTRAVKLTPAVSPS